MLRAAALVTLCSCASSATLITLRGTTEATLLGGDDDALLVMTEAGAKRRVLRDDVRDIDHPGSVLAVIFGPAGAMLGLETVGFAVGGLCGDDIAKGGAGPIPCMFAGAMSAASLGLFAWGLYTWFSSRNAVFNPLPASEGPASKYPLAFPDETPPAQPPPPSLLPVPAL